MNQKIIDKSIDNLVTTKDMKNILVADKIADEAINYLKEQNNFNVVCQAGLSETELCKEIPKYHGIIIRSATKLTRDILQYAKNLEVIGRAGIGVDNIDIDSATEFGIVILNTPDANATTTAELAIAHIFSLSRNLPLADLSVKSGEWKRSAFIGTELRGKLLGIIGYGTIGRIVSERAIGLKMKVCVYDPFVTQEVFEENAVIALPLDELVEKADYITLHCPINDNTRNVISAERIANMKPGTHLINCARGGLVDETALYDALNTGSLAGAALDVFENEPPVNSPLLKLANVVFTPHLGASTHEAQIVAGVEIAQQVSTYLETKEPVNAINLPSISTEDLKKLQPYNTLANRLGRLIASFVNEPISEVEVTLSGENCDLDVRPVAIEVLVGLLSKKLSGSINRVNAAQIAKRQGIHLIESRSGESPNYHSVLSVKVNHGDSQLSLAGTFFRDHNPRLVFINDYEIETVLDGHLLFTYHKDKPGVVATLGTILANADINIIRMQLGIAPNTDIAIAVLEVSETINDNILQKINNIEEVYKALQLSL